VRPARVTRADFDIDWQAYTVTCPRGVTSPPWKPTWDDGHPHLSVLFPRKACRECEVRLQCTGNLEGKGRHITLLPRAQQEIQTRVRAEQEGERRRARYALRPNAKRPSSTRMCV
jgi:Transposase DDE domain